MPATRSGSLPPNSGAHQTSGWPSATTHSARSTNDCSVRSLRIVIRVATLTVQSQPRLPACSASKTASTVSHDVSGSKWPFRIGTRGFMPAKPLRSHIASTKNLVAQFGNDIGA